MFKNLLKFSYKRSVLEAIGLYISYLVLIILLSALSGLFLGLISGNENNFELGVRIGMVVAILTSLILSFLIISAKKMTNRFTYILLAVLSGVLAYFGGGLLGLIPAAFLSTRG